MNGELSLFRVRGVLMFNDPLCGFKISTQISQVGAIGGGGSIQCLSWETGNT